MELYLNTIHILGKVADFPHFTETKDGVPYATFSVATHGKYTDRDGEQQTYTEYHHLEMYGTLVDVCRTLDLKANDRVYVTGEVRTKKYICKTDNVQKFLTTVKVHRITVDTMCDNCNHSAQ